MGTWKFKVEANNPLSTFAPDEWIGLYLVISLWHSHLRSVWNVTPKRGKWEGYTASVITPLARVQLQLQTAVAYSCGCVNLCWRKNKVFGFADAWIYVDAKMKYSVSPHPDSCGCGLRHFLLTSHRSWVAVAMSFATSSWRNEAISIVTCVFLSFALVETLLSRPSCAWREDRLILPSFRWKGFSGRTWLKAVVSWCFGWVQSANDVIQKLTTTP